MYIENRKVLWRTAMFAITRSEDRFFIYQKLGYKYRMIGICYEDSFDAVTEVLDAIDLGREEGDFS